MKKIAFIDSTYANTKNEKYSGVGYYRIQKPAQYLKGYKVKVYQKDIIKLGKTTEDLYTKLFNNHDLIVTKAVDSPRAAAAMAFMSEHTGKPYLVDLDDNYFTVRPDQPGYKDYYPGSQKRAIFSAYLSTAAGIICSTKPLAEYYRKFMKEVHGKDIPVFVAPNFNDVTDFQFKPKRKKKGKIVIGWQGSTTHEADLRLVMPAIVKVMEDNPNVYFEVLGALTDKDASRIFSDFEMSESVLDRISLASGTQSWEGYPELLSKQAWDIGIAPLINDEFNRGKSHIKWMEYAGYRIPCVASKVYPYYKDISGTKTIRHGKTGYLARTVDEWVKYLQLLINSDTLRKEIGENAYCDIIKNWQPQNHIKTWVEIFNQYI